MHRVNTKRKKAVILRFIAYGITLTLSVLTTVLLLYIALGYRLGNGGNVVRSGLLLVNNSPEDAAIYINNELKDNAAPGRFVLSAGDYDLALKQTGYRDWSKRVNLEASGVREVNYPLLVPNELSSRSVATLGAPSFVSQSQDRRFLLSFQAGQASMTLTELDPKEPKQTTIAFSSAFTEENAQLGSFKLIEWALNNKQILLEHILPSGKVELISLDVTKPAEAINITRLYSSEAPTNIHYVGGNTKQVYGVSNGILKRYQLENTESETLLQNVVSYQPYSDDTILFTRTTATGQHEVGIWQDKTTTVIQANVDPSLAPLLSYAKYDDHFYFVVAESGGNAVTIYRDPLKKPILSKQLPLVRLVFEKPQKVLFSDSAQFVMVQNGSTFQTYDLEDLRQFTVTLPFTLAEGSTLSWMDGFHIQAVSADNTSYILEYDGLNQQKLLSSRGGTRLYFAGNFQHVYRVQDLNGITQLEVTSLVNGKE